MTSIISYKSPGLAACSSRLSAAETLSTAANYCDVATKV